MNLNLKIKFLEKVKKKKKGDLLGLPRGLYFMAFTYLLYSMQYVNCILT